VATLSDVRRLAVSLALVASAVAGVLAAAALAGANPVALVTTGTTTGGPAPTGTTTTVPTTTQPEPLIAPGVRVGGVAVGGLTPEGALAKVRETFAAPLPIVVAGRRLAPRPASFGAIVYAKPAVERARRAAPGAVVPMLVRVRGQLVRAYVARLAKRFDRRSTDAALRLRDLRPFITKERLGRQLLRPAATQAIVGRLLRTNRAPLRLRLRAVRPAVTRASFGSIVVIRRGSKRLFLYRGMRFQRVFGVATGTSTYPTPLGRFSVITMQRNPWWYPPDSDWAQDLDPVPPGPGNPLGTRWMGISSPGVGIHGTPDAASIGYSASHGCIRMRIPDAEQLFRLIGVGTPVFIVAA
jgi:lipoprotein-anchoring transpeptidase ErfK/SrfK